MSTVLEQNLATILNEKQTKIIPENIKKGINIFGIEGELEFKENIEYIKPSSTVRKLILNKEITLSKPYSELNLTENIGGGFNSSNRWINWLNASSDMFCSTVIQENSIYASFVPRIVNTNDSYGYDKTLINVLYSSNDGIHYILNENELLQYKEMWEQEGVIGKFFDLDTTTWTFQFKEDQLLGDIGPNQNNSVSVNLEWTTDFASPFIVPKEPAIAAGSYNNTNASGLLKSFPCQSGNYYAVAINGVGDFINTGIVGADIIADVKWGNKHVGEIYMRLLILKAITSSISFTGDIWGVVQELQII